MSTTVAIVQQPPTPSPSTEDLPHVYGCEHVEAFLKKQPDRTRQEYDSAMSIVIRSSYAKSRQVKVFQYLTGDGGC